MPYKRLFLGILEMRKKWGQDSDLPPQIFRGCIIGFYAFPASFRARSTFSGLRGSVRMRTPVAL